MVLHYTPSSAVQSAVTQIGVIVKKLTEDVGVLSAQDLGYVFSNSILQPCSSTLAQSDVLRLTVELCYEYDLRLDQIINAYPTQTIVNEVDVVRKIIHHRDLQISTVVDQVASHSDLLRSLKVTSAADIVKLLNNGPSIDTVEPGLLEAIEGLPLKDFTEIHHVVNCSYYMGALAVLDRDKELHHKCSLPAADAINIYISEDDVFQSLLGKGSGIPKSISMASATSENRETTYYQPRNTTNQDSKQKDLAPTIQLVTNVVAKCGHMSADSLATLLDACIQTAGGGGPTGAQLVMETLAELILRENLLVADVAAQVCGGKPVEMLKVMQDMIDRHTGTMTKYTTVDNAGAVLTLCHSLLQAYRISPERLFEKVDHAALLSSLSSLIHTHKVHIPALIMTVVGDDKDTAYQILQGLSNQFDISIDDMAPYLQAHAGKPEKIRTLNTLISFYNLDLLDAVVAVNPSDILSFLRSLIDHFQVDMLHLFEGNNTDILRLLRASDLHITDAVEPLRADLSDLCAVAEKMGLRWEQSDPRARAQATAAEKKARKLSAKEKVQEATTSGADTAVGDVAAVSGAVLAFAQRDALRNRMRHEVVYLLQHFGIDIFSLLDLYPFGPEECKEIVKRAQVPITDLCAAYGYNSKSVMPLLRDLISHFSVNAEEVLTLANPARLTIAHVFRHFCIDATTAIGTLRQLYDTHLVDIMPLYNSTDEEHLAGLVSRFGSNLPAVIQHVSPTKEEAIESVKVLIQTSKLGVADMAKIWKCFPLQISELLTHFRVTVSDILQTLKNTNIQLEELVDIMLHGKNREQCINFINSLIYKHNISIMEIQSQHRQSLASLLSAVGDLVCIKQLDDITDTLNGMTTQKTTSLNDIARATYLFGVMAAIARFKHAHYLERIISGLKQELPMTVDKMLHTMQFTFPSIDVECQTITHSQSQAVQAVVPTRHSEAQFDLEVQHKTVQATVHSTKRAVQTLNTPLVDGEAQYVFEDISEDVGTQTRTATNDRYTDPMEIPLIHTAIQCARLVIPTIPRTTQATMLVSHAAVQATVKQVHCYAEAIASTCDQASTVFPDMKHQAHQVWHPAPRASVLLQTVDPGSVDRSSQTQFIGHKPSSVQCDAITCFDCDTQTDTTEMVDVEVYAPKPRMINSGSMYVASDKSVATQVEHSVRSIGILCTRLTRSDLTYNGFQPPKLDLFQRHNTSRGAASPTSNNSNNATKNGSTSNVTNLNSSGGNSNNNRKRRMTSQQQGKEGSVSSSGDSSKHQQDPSTSDNNNSTENGDVMRDAANSSQSDIVVEHKAVQAILIGSNNTGVPTERQCIVNIRMATTVNGNSNTNSPMGLGGLESKRGAVNVPSLIITRHKYCGPKVKDSESDKANDDVFVVSDDQLRNLEKRIAQLAPTLVPKDKTEDISTGSDSDTPPTDDELAAEQRDRQQMLLQEFYKLIENKTLLNFALDFQQSLLQLQSELGATAGVRTEGGLPRKLSAITTKRVSVTDDTVRAILPTRKFVPELATNPTTSSHTPTTPTLHAATSHTISPTPAFSLRPSTAEPKLGERTEAGNRPSTSF